MDDLRSKAVKGVLFLGAGKSAGKLISFINTLILARILLPADYGLMAMAMVVTGFISFFNEIGLGSAIIQRPELTARQLNGCFYVAMATSLLLYGLTYFSRGQVADFYGNPEIAPILAVIASSFVIGALCTVSDALLRKHLRFKFLAGIEFAGILLQCGLTLLLAWLGFKTWALVYGFIAAQLLRSIATLLYCDWRPGKLEGLREAVGLIKFGLAVTYSRITWYAYSNAQTLILGKVAGDKQLGIFDIANSIATLPTANITSIIIKVASPLFSKLQGDRQQLNSSLIKMTSGLALICFPLLAGLSLTAHELVPILLGANWLDARFPLQVLCLLGFFKSIDPLLTQALISTGQVRITARYTSICALVVPISVYFGAIWRGIDGAAILMVSTYPALVLLLLYLVRHYLQLSIRQYLLALITPVSACLAMSLCVYLSRQALLPWTTEPVVLLAVQVLVGVFSYLLWLVYVRPDAMAQLKQMLTDIGIAEHKLNRWPFNRPSKGRL